MVGLSDSTAPPDPAAAAPIAARLRKLEDALAGGRSVVSCRRRWSEFIRERDGHRCVDCHSRARLSAHHICRKSFVASAQFETGNGITLCSTCHHDVHRGFNGRPDIYLPVDAQGGEKLAFMERLYSILVDDALERGLMREDFYFLSDALLASFKQMQGYDPATPLPGSRVEQAFLILAEPERQMRTAVAAANGFSMPHGPLLPGGAVLLLNGDDGQHGTEVVLRSYRTRSVAGSGGD